jgi:MFS family permease
MGMLDPTIQALTADRTTPENRQAAYSLIYLGHNIGFAAGPVIAGFLFNDHTRLLFLGDAGTSIVAVVLIALFARESRPSREEIAAIGAERPREAGETGHVLGVLFRRPVLLLFMIASIAMTFVYAQFTFAIPLHMELVFGGDGAQLYGVLMTTNAVIVVLLTAPLVALTRRRRPIILVAFSAVLYTIGFGALRWAQWFWFFLASTFVWTVGEILTATNVDAFIANHTPASHRGRVNAIAPIIIGAGFAVSPAIVGSWIEEIGVAAVWSRMALLSIFAALVMFILAVADRRGDTAPLVDDRVPTEPAPRADKDTPIEPASST